MRELDRNRIMRVLEIHGEMRRHARSMAASDDAQRRLAEMLTLAFFTSELADWVSQMAPSPTIDDIMRSQQ